MRTLLAAVLLMFTLPSLADSYIDLYQAGGWPQQRAHFRDALSSAQQRYRNSLPPAIYQALVDNSNQRFTAAGMDQRALAGLRQLSDPQPALAFFQSPLGRKIINAEVLATQREQLAQYAKGVPRSQAGATRRELIGQLSQALPAKEAGAEVSLALASVAADSLSQMMPGLLGGGQAQAMLDNQRQRLMGQIGSDLDNSLLFVYRELSEAELQAFVDFAQSTDGKAYYQAALAALRAGLAVGQSSASLAP
ncbi:hypothetical protein [Pseudomonas sp.]|uniref:hypothetical protein n=1 Tax=Pseudomonas sp. TaxID=306 RepID=UPI003BB50ACE